MVFAVSRVGLLPCEAAYRGEVGGGLARVGFLHDAVGIRSAGKGRGPGQLSVTESRVELSVGNAACAALNCDKVSEA